MPRLTFNSIKTSRIPILANVCPDDPNDPRLAQWVSSFEERASNQGRWWGTTQLAQFCITSGCKIVLPREVAVVEAASLNGVPMNVRNQWYQFVRPHIDCSRFTTPSGFVSPFGGMCNCGCGCGPATIEDSNVVASFATTTGNNQKIRTYPGGTSDVGKKIIYQGYDKNNIWVRTEVDGAFIDGEQVILAQPFVDTVTIWGSGAPTAVIKDETDYRVLVYSVDQTNALEIQLAEYQPSETLPSYRTMTIPGYRHRGGFGTSCCTQDSLLAIVSLQPQPIKNGNDFLLFTNLSAYSDGVQSEKFRESGDYAAANAFFFGTPAPARNGRGVARVNIQSGAIPQLVAELRKNTGDRTSANVDRDGIDLCGFI